MTFGWGRWFRWLSGSGDGVRAVGMAWIGLYGMRGKSAGSTCTWSWCVWGGLEAGSVVRSIQPAWSSEAFFCAKSAGKWGIGGVFLPHRSWWKLG